MGRFIEITVDGSTFTRREYVDAVVAACPVDIYAAEDGLLTVVDLHVDECILCGRCLMASPPGGVAVRRRYGTREALRLSDEGPQEAMP